ncbi:MAG: hypothetical protein ABJH63_06590 [Rhizobiaceae bacterium]
MPDSNSAEDMVIRIAALKAAKDAADHMAKSNTQKAPSSVGAFALYTWGSLALMSAMYAVALGVNLDSFTFQTPQFALVETQTIDQIAQKVQPPVKEETPQVANSEPRQLTPLETTTLPRELSQLPAPLVPKVELRTDHLAAVETNQMPEYPVLDRTRTGSVDALDGDDLQPFPDDILPQNLFAVDIGGATTIAPLIGRYSALKRRAPDLFSDLEPRIQLKGADSSLEARLVAGPFTSQDQVSQFCRSLRLRLTVDCSMSSFEGDTIQ